MCKYPAGAEGTLKRGGFRARAKMLVHLTHSFP